MKRFYYIRHGETDWNTDHKLQGRADISLNARGMEQAHQAKEFLKGLGITKIICSPLLRARQTAEILNEVLGVDIVISCHLSEIDFVSMEGKVVSDIVKDAEQNPCNYHLETMFPFPLVKDAECLDGFMSRIKQGVIDVAEQEDNILLFVGHGGYMLGVQKLLFGTPPIVSKNATPYLFFKENEQWKMQEVNEETYQSIQPSFFKQELKI